MKNQSKGIYDGDFKRKAVELHLKERYGYKKVAKMLGIPSATSVRDWTGISETEGPQALDGVKLGGHTRREQLEFPKPKKLKGNSSLEKEVEWLRAENAYLKKLEALVANRGNTIIKEFIA